jgi:hypothetical protein
MLTGGYRLNQAGSLCRQDQCRKRLGHIAVAWRYNGHVITLSENEERLVEALRALPPDAADQVIAWATRLRDLANGRGVDWSATWTNEDLADAQRASLSSFDEREREEF